MADTCTYTYKSPDGEEKKFDDKDELYKHLLSDQVKPEHILSRIKPEGYAQPKSEAILTPKGFVSIGSIGEGDVVFGENGNEINVLKVYEKGRLGVYRVFLEDKSSVLCSIDHLWSVYKTIPRKASLKKDKKLITISTEQIIKDIEDGYIIRLPELEAIRFGYKTLPIPPYTLGAILGDGAIYKNYARITGRDEEICKKSMAECGMISKRLKDTHGLYTWRFAFNNNELEVLDLHGKKSFSKRIPPIYLTGSIHQRMELLRGLLDTDGTIARRNEVRFFSCNEALANDVRMLVLSLGGIASVSNYNVKNSFRSSIGKYYTVTISINRNPFFISRKKNKWKPKIKGLNRRITSIVPCEKEEDCVCIKVAGLSSLYITKDYILTHNTKENAITKSQGQEPEGNQQTSISEHPRTGTPRDEEAEPQTNSGNRGSDSEGTRKEKEVADRERTAGIKNAAVAEDRAARGLKPVIKAARKRFGRVWEEARNHVIQGTADPRAFVNNLADRFAKKERFGVTDYDNALVLMDRIDLTNQRIGAIDDYEKAVKSGNDMLEAVAWQRLQEVEGRLQQNDEVSDKMGTVASLALGTRRAMANLDYSLVQMKKQIGVYYPGGVVPPEMQKRLEEIEKQHREALQKLQEYEERFKQEQAEKQFAGEVAKTTKESKGKPGPKGKQRATGKELADRIRAIRPKTDAAQSNIFGLGYAIYDTGLVIAANIVETGGKLVDAIKAAVDHIKENGGFPSQKDEDDFVAHLSNIDAPEEQDPKEYYQNKIAELAKNSNAETLTKDMITPLRQLINQYAREGHTDFQTVLEQVHEDLKDNFSNLTKEDLRDAYSGYGDLKLETKTELAKKLAKWKQEATQWAQMQQIIAGKKPSRKGGVPPDPEMVKRRGELEKRMREAGITWENAPDTEEEKNKRALDSLKTRIQNQINQLTQAIEDRKPLAKSGKVQLDEAAKNMIKQRDALKETLNSILGKEDKKTLSDKDRIDRAQKTLEKQISSLEDDIKAIYDNTYQGKPPKKLPYDATVALLRGRKEALQELKNKLVIDYDPKSNQSQIALEKYKDSIRDKILDYQRRLETNDFEYNPNKKAFENDAEAKDLEMQLKRAQAAFAQQKEVARKANRTRIQKIYDRINTWKRFSVLTGIPTIGKLLTAVTYRSVFNPVEEMTGAALGLLPGFRTVSGMAPREGGGFNFKAERSALYEWAKAETYKDFMQVVKTGQGELDYRFGKYVSWPPETLEVMGRIHGSLKNFAKRAEFARAYDKRMDYAIRNGADPSDSLAQLTAMSKAYEDANRNIFMQKNWLVDHFNDALKNAEKEGNIYAKTAAAVTRFLLPIMKIPANYVSETLNYTFGSARVLELAARALSGHLKDMSEDEADSLYRSLKKGSLGIAALAIGYSMPNSFGGYYYKGRPQGEDDLGYGQINFLGLHIPNWATHFPLFEVMQLGATMRRVQDGDIEKGKQTEAAIGDGIVKSGRGLVGEVPLFSTPEEILEAGESGDIMNKFVYPQIGSNIPLGIQQVAKWTDTEPKRDPQGLGEQLEYRVPGLRENVPTKEQRQEDSQ